MISRQEIENIMKTFGLKPNEDGDFLYGNGYNLTILMYVKGTGEAAIWLGEGFSNWVVLKSTVIELLTNTIVRIKKEQMNKRLDRISNDF